MERFRRLFPVTGECIYFNHAATGPMSLSARRVIESCLDIYTRQAEFDLDDYFAHVAGARTKIADLIGAAETEITFTHNTSEGVFIVLINLPLQPGDKILVMEEVFPAVRYVVENNLPGIEKKFIPFSNRDPVEAVRPHLDAKVRVVVVDFVQFLTGAMIDVKRLGRFLRPKGIYLVVDGIQAIGACDFQVGDCSIDFLACGAAKWLFGPSGAGFLYVNKENFPALKKIHTGWLGADWSNFEDFQRSAPLFEDARMFEQGTRNIIGIRAMAEHIRILLDFGLENVEARIRTLKQDLSRGFGELGYEIITPQQNPQSGIITVRPDKDARRIFNLLKEARIIVSLRNGCLRFSPHFYNTQEEVERILDVLRKD